MQSSAARKILNKIRVIDDQNTLFNNWTKTYSKFISNFPINEGEDPREFLDLDKMFELMLDFYKKIREKTLKSLNEHIVK